MPKSQSHTLIPQEVIENKIFVFQGKKVMLDRDLAMLYEVPTKRLNEQVKRNIKRFPDYFMFQLGESEKNELVANCDRFKTLKHSTALPFAFTEYGVAMLSSVLNSEKAIQINIQIIGAFIKMREMFEDFNKNRVLIEKIKRDNDERFGIYHRIIEAHSKDIKTIYKLLAPPEETKKDEIGFKTDQKK
ncbi:MAG: ORF6N domain-containing protein [bacterium]